MSPSPSPTFPPPAPYRPSTAATFPPPAPYRPWTAATFPPPAPYRPGDEHGAARARRRHRWGTAALAAFVVVAAVAGYGPAGAVLVGFALLSPLERAFRRHPWTMRRPQVRTDIAHLLFSGTLLTVATGAGVVAVVVATWPLHGGDLDGPLTALPPLAGTVVGFALFEVASYWSHRASHRIPLLWRFHKVHHSSERLDWIAAARLHPFEGFFAMLVLGPPLVLLGVPPVELGVFGVVAQVWALLLHANVSWRLRWLDGIIGTPEHHHWHHSSDPVAWNTNYSALLPPLDRLFGTFYRSTERRPEAYGIGEPVPDGWWAHMVWPLRRRSGRAGGPPAGAPATPGGPPSVTGSPGRLQPAG